jgi:integrase/recombinase XerD
VLDEYEGDRIIGLMSQSPDSTALVHLSHQAHLVPDEEDLLERNAALVYLNGLQSVNSRNTMRERLQAIAKSRGVGCLEDFPWAALDFSEVEAIRSEFVSKHSPATANLTLSALRGVFKAAWRLQQIDGDRYQRLRDVQKVKGSRLPPGRDLSDAEIARLRACFEALGGPYGAMIRGLAATFLGAGLRREEVCQLPFSALSGRSFRVIGKGNKEREVPLSKHALAEIQAWIRVRKKLEIPLEWMFVRVTKDNVIHSRPFSVDAIYNLVVSWAPILKVNPLDPEEKTPRLTPHDMRRTFATRALDKGIDVLIVQRWLGHSDPATTGKYDRRAEREAEQAMDKIEIY